MLNIRSRAYYESSTPSSQIYEDDLTAHIFITTSDDTPYPARRDLERNCPGDVETRRPTNNNSLCRDQLTAGF